MNKIIFFLLFNVNAGNTYLFLLKHPNSLTSFIQAKINVVSMEAGKLPFKYSLAKCK